MYGGGVLMQGASIDSRLSVDAVGLDLRTMCSTPARTFLFAGRLQTGGGATFSGGPLTLDRPLHQIADSAEFLTASGLTLRSTPGADEQTILVVGDCAAPIWVFRESHDAADGRIAIAVTVSGKGTVRRASFSVAPGNSAARLAAAKGTATVAGDGHIVLDMPNPLAVAAASLPQTLPGLRIDFPNFASRSLP